RGAGRLDLGGDVVDARTARLDGRARAGLVLRDEPEEVIAPRPATRPDVAGADLGLLDLDIGVEDDAQEVVRPVSLDDGALATDAPVVRQADLVHGPALDRQRRHPVGHEDAGLDRAPGRDDRRPLAVDQALLL